MIRIPLPPVRPLVRCTLKRAVRALPSALLLLFVLSLVLVTLLQIALVHSSHRRPSPLHPPLPNATSQPNVMTSTPPSSSHKSNRDTLRVEAFLDKTAPTLEGSAAIVRNMLNCARVRRILEGLGARARRGNKVGVLAAATPRDDFKWHRRKACLPVPPGLRGRLDISANASTPAEWSCASRHRVAVVVPYRDRLDHLAQLLRTLHPLLRRQQLFYRVYVIEQYGNSTFNKGVLMNAGVREALRDAAFDCFVFHDVDMIPEDDRNLYSCPTQPRHLSVAVDKFNYTLPYTLLVGGVFSISLDHFLQVNGYSNLYWGWGGEDDDMAYRIKYRKLEIIRPPETFARYSMIKHHHRPESPNAIRSALLRMAKKRSSRDGLNTVKYRVVRVRETSSHTHVTVDIGHHHRWRFLDHQRLVINF